MAKGKKGKGAKGKGAKGKGKGAKGKKKGKKGQKSIIKKLSVTFAKIHRYVFPDDESFLLYLPHLDFNLPIYVLFKCASDHQMESGSDEKSFEAVIDEFLEAMQADCYSKDIVYVTVHMDHNRLGCGPLTLFPWTRLEVLPTLLKWGGVGKLEGEEVLRDNELLGLLFNFDAKEIPEPPKPLTPEEKPSSTNKRHLLGVRIADGGKKSTKTNAKGKKKKK